MSKNDSGGSGKNASANRPESPSTNQSENSPVSQLSWDSFLEPSSTPEKSEPESKGPQSKPKKKTVRKSSKAADVVGETSYSSKDWGPLDFAPTKAEGSPKTEPSGSGNSEPAVDNSVESQKFEPKPDQSAEKGFAERTELDVALESRSTIRTRKKTTGKEASLEVELTSKSAAMAIAPATAPPIAPTTMPAAVPAQPEVVVEKEPDILTVSELNKYIRSLLEGQFPLLWLKGEISNFKAHTSGHFYFSLKDSKAQISAVMFRGFNSQLKFRPQDGMEVIIRGKVTVYEPRGNYQIFCELMEPVGAGALQKAFEQLKAKLQREGLFDEARKRPLPQLPRHIAIVTSPTGAAIRDMLNVLARRFRGCRISVVPCKVQGDQAPGEICDAIDLANRLEDVDVMIVGRGGGSIEDLWAFNDERVARKIAASRVPVISAVGHEIDFTIADFVADLRAPTPSAAAELVVQSAAEIQERLKAIERTLRYSALRHLNSLRQMTRSVSKRLIDPQRRLQDVAIRCDELQQRLESAVARIFNDRRMKVQLMRNSLGKPLDRVARLLDSILSLRTRLRSGVRNSMARKRDGLQRHMALLDSLSPLKVLDRGYSMVIAGDAIVTDAQELKVDQEINIRMCQGSVDAKVVKIHAHDPKKKTEQN